jgi:hypothetical protein
MVTGVQTCALPISDLPLKLKAGDYLSVKGKSGVPEQDALVVPGTNQGNVHTIIVNEYKTLPGE